jgi:F0F1-type ATP synthase membrane subunit b/b'
MPQQNGVYDLLRNLEMALEEGFPIIPKKFTIVRTKEFETLIDRIYASLPVEVQEARAFLRRREELQAEAQAKAEKIVNDAQAEADRKLSEADFIKALEREGARIRSQVQQECEEIKRRAMEEADNIRAQASDDARKTKEGAELYAEQVLTRLENLLTQEQQTVKNGQIYMEKLRADSFGSYDVPTSYSTERPQVTSDYYNN